MWVDGGYRGRLLEWVTERCKFDLAVVLRPKQTKQFVRLPRRWVVERTFGWLNHSLRLSKSSERLACTDETWISISMTRLMLNRVA
jgi:putative transposase